MLAILRTMKHGANDRASHPVVYQRRDRFTLSGDYIVYHAALSAHPDYLPCYVLGPLHHPAVRDTVGPLAPERIRALLARRLEWNAAGCSKEPCDDLVALASTGGHHAARCLAEFCEIHLRDPRRAIAWYQAAADGGDARAVWRPAHLYDRGHGVPADPARAIRLCAEAAILGIREAQYAIAECYRQGRALGRDLSAALAWYLKAKLNGYGPAEERIRECRAADAEPTGLLRAGATGSP